MGRGLAVEEKWRSGSLLSSYYMSNTYTKVFAQAILFDLICTTTPQSRWSYTPNYRSEPKTQSLHSYQGSRCWGLHGVPSVSMPVLLIVHSLVEQICLCHLLWLCLSVLRIIDLELEIFSDVVSSHQLICLSKLINLSILSYSDQLRCQYNLYFTSHPWYSQYKSWSK